MINKRTATKTQYLLKLEPYQPKPKPNEKTIDVDLWRKICIRGMQTVFDLHIAILTSLELEDNQAHQVLVCFNSIYFQFVLPNGQEIGKVAKNRRMNERVIKISQLFPTDQYWVYYDVGTMFADLKRLLKA